MISYDPDTHSYFEGKTYYRNVSSIVNKYVPEFPKGLIAAQVAKRDGREPEEVLDQWAMAGEVSTLYGDAVHKAIELYIKYGVICKTNHIKEAVEQIAKIIKRENVVSELIVKDDELKIAGRLDMIEKLGDRRVIINDTKTNYDLDGSKGYMLPPFDNLKNSNLNKYRLQQSIYRHLLMRQNLTVEKIRLFHWNGEFQIIDLEPLDVSEIL